MKTSHRKLLPNGSFDEMHAVSGNSCFFFIIAIFSAKYLELFRFSETPDSDRWEVQMHMGKGLSANWQNLLDDLIELLRSEQDFVSDGVVLRNVVVEAALGVDPRLLKLLMRSEVIKSNYFGSSAIFVKRQSFQALGLRSSPPKWK